MNVAKSEFENWRDTADYISIEEAYVAGFNRALDLLTKRFTERSFNYGNTGTFDRQEQHVQVHAGRQCSSCVEETRLGSTD